MVKRIRRKEPDAAVLEALARIGDLNAERDKINKEREPLRVRVTDAMTKMRRKHLKAKGIDGQTYQATRKRTETLVLNEAKLRRALGAKVWRQITTPQFDQAKWELYLRDHEDALTIYAACCEEKNGPWYIDVRPVKE